jgi:hypothetical protein
MENMMAQHYDTEAHDAKLQQLIDARIMAVDNDIFLGRKATLSAVAELADLNADEEEAEMLVRAAVVGRSWLVGARIAETVRHAIYLHVLPLAEADLVAAEREGADLLVSDVYAALVDRIAA